MLTTSQSPKRKNVHVTFSNHLGPNLTGLDEPEKEALQFILECIDQEIESNPNKLKFLRAVETLSSAVHAMSQDNINKYIPKVILASKIETLILEEPTESLDSTILQQAMVCIVSLSQVHPPFYMSQRLDLVRAAILRVFSLPLIMHGIYQEEEQKNSIFLYNQTLKALDEMVQALVMQEVNPDMNTLQKFLEIILPWLTESEEVHEQVRAVCTISHLLRFICNFSKLLNIENFSIYGKLMGIAGIFCMHRSSDISMAASEVLHYVLKILVMQRGEASEIEDVLKNLQKHYHGNWFSNIQDLTMFFTQYLTPEERTDVIIVLLEAMASAKTDSEYAGSQIMNMLLKHSLEEIGKVQEVIQFLCDNLNKVTDTESFSVTKNLFNHLAQTYTEELILTLLDTDSQVQRGAHMHWGILSSFPQGYEMVVNLLLQRLMSRQTYKKKEEVEEEKEQSSSRKISLLTATKAIHQLLLESSQRIELQTYYSPLFLALLFQLSFLVMGRDTEVIQKELIACQLTDAVSSTLEALKTLMKSIGYEEQVTYIQQFGGWDLLSSPEGHYEGVILLARAMVVKDCWHKCPIFYIIISTLKDFNDSNHLVILLFLTELLKSQGVARMLDKKSAGVLGKYFRCEELNTLTLLMQMVETILEHKNMVKQFQMLQPWMFKCYCHLVDQGLVQEMLSAMQALVVRLSWRKHYSFLTQLSFMLEPFLDEESEVLRVTAFEIYWLILTKVKRRIMIFPLRHQVLSLMVLMVLHLVDENVCVVQICRPILCCTAHILGWSKLKVIFAKKNIWAILQALLSQEQSKASWFLKQSVELFRSPQANIRWFAVWFAGQILQSLCEKKSSAVEDSYLALRDMEEDPDPIVSSLATQTLYVLEAKERAQALC